VTGEVVRIAWQKTLLAHRVSGLSGGSQATGIVELGLVVKTVAVNCSSRQHMFCSCSCGHRTCRQDKTFA